MKNSTKKTNLSYLWHYNVHKGFRESLLYILLSFSPVYRREEIFSALKDFMKSEDIGSYCIYELFGYYDLMLRIWLPSYENHSEFRKKLFRELQDFGCIREIPFYVEENPYHWKWWDREINKPLVPSDTDIKELLKDIVEVENVNNNKADQSTLDKLEKKLLLKKYDPEEGIRFFIVIPPPALGMIPTPVQIIEGIQNQLAKLLVDIKEPSIYFGNGFAWFLVKGKVPFKKYCAITNLLKEINKVGIRGFQIRTYTYLIAGISLLDYIEEERIAILPLESTKEKDISYYITHEEDEKFEIKGSLYFDVDRYARDKEYKYESDSKENKIKIATNGVLKSIVGFLNAEGGKILIGVLETQKYIDVLQKPDNPLSNLSQIDNRIVFGVNKDYGLMDWDKFSRGLTDIICEYISKEVSTFIKIQKHSYEDKDLCLIEVPKGSEWYYLDKNRFYVRRYSSTILLEGREMDSYKRLYPRKA